MFPFILAGREPAPAPKTPLYPSPQSPQKLVLAEYSVQNASWVHEMTSFWLGLSLKPQTLAAWCRGTDPSLLVCAW